jgi:hypothetical protein
MLFHGFYFSHSYSTIEGWHLNLRAFTVEYLVCRFVLVMLNIFRETVGAFELFFVDLLLYLQVHVADVIDLERVDHFFVDFDICFEHCNYIGIHVIKSTATYIILFISEEMV